MNVLTVFMLVTLVLFLLLYRTMKPKVVHLSDDQNGEAVHQASTVKAVKYRRASDQVELLEQVEDEEDLGEEDDKCKVISLNELSTSESTPV